MTTIASIYPDNYPPKWEIFDQYAPTFEVKDFGLCGWKGDVNWFAARYRLAKSMKSVTLHGYHSSTTEGYTALFGNFLAWSAFEQFLKIIGRRQNSIDDILSKYPVNDWIEEIRSQPDSAKLILFLLKNANTTHRKAIAEYIRRRPFNFTYLPSIVRHVFAHGTLTPNVGNVPSETIVNICRVNWRGCLKIMDSEWSELMTAFESKVSSS